MKTTRILPIEGKGEHDCRRAIIKLDGIPSIECRCKNPSARHTAQVRAMEAELRRKIIEREIQRASE